jgi:anti-anti-sigma factor
MDTEVVLHESDDLRIVERSRSGRSVLSFTGSITFKTRRPVQDAITKLYAQGCRSLVLHLTEVPFVDSVALAIITLTWRNWNKAGRLVVIARPSPYLKELLDFADISKLVSTFDSVDEAIKFTESTCGPKEEKRHGFPS